MLGLAPISLQPAMAKNSGKAKNGQNVTTANTQMINLTFIHLKSLLVKTMNVKSSLEIPIHVMVMVSLFTLSTRMENNDTF